MKGLWLLIISITSKRIALGVDAPAVTPILSKEEISYLFNSFTSLIKIAFLLWLITKSYKDLQLLLRVSPIMIKRSKSLILSRTAFCLFVVALQTSSLHITDGYFFSISLNVLVT